MDNSFLNLITEENINKIKIDRALIPAFKKTMRNFQEYFNYMGYTNTRNYEELFEKFIISKYGIRNIKIECNNKPSYENANGLYDSYKNKITIDNSLLDNPTDVLDTLTHEFIHFLIMQELRYKRKSTEMIDNQFLNEPLTEILKMKILPLTYESYHPEILMIKFWLLLNNKKIDFNTILNNGKFYNLDFEFIKVFRIYWNKREGSENILDVITNPLYINIQRYLINNIDLNSINNLDDYEILISKLSNRPVKDIKFINNFYKKIELRLCYLLDIDDKYNKKIMAYLKKYRELLEFINNNENFKYKDVFYYYDNKYQIDYKNNIYRDCDFDGKGTGLLLENDFGDTYRLLIDKEKKLNLKYKNLNLKKSNIRNKPMNIRRKELLIKKKNYLKSVLYYLIFINNNEIIEDNILTK